MSEIHNDLLVPNCTTKNEGVYLRMNWAVYMDASILEFSGGRGEGVNKVCTNEIWQLCTSQNVQY
jgi:hypothetical protein